MAFLPVQFSQSDYVNISGYVSHTGYGNNIGFGDDADPLLSGVTGLFLHVRCMNPLGNTFLGRTLGPLI